MRKHVAQSLLVTRHIPSGNQVADLFTKPLPKATLRHFYDKLCLQPRQSLREGVNRDIKATIKWKQNDNNSDQSKQDIQQLKGNNTAANQRLIERNQQQLIGVNSNNSDQLSTVK